jgi:hypothetical protein
VSRDGGGGAESRVSPFRRTSALAFAVVFVGIGIALIVETAILGGGIGYLIGLLFAAAGAGRFYVTWKRRSVPPS